jgi:hypothetical protein
MSREDSVRVTCDGCGKKQDCLRDDLERGTPEQQLKRAHVPKGWLLVSAFAEDEWSGDEGAIIRPKTITVQNDLDNTFHACSRSCAAGLLDELSSLLVAQ